MNVETRPKDTTMWRSRRSLLSIVCAAVTAMAIGMVAEKANAQCEWDNTLGQPGFFTDGSPGRMIAYNGELIVSGLFTTIGGVTVNNIARWDGSSWQPMGSGLNDMALSTTTVYNGELIVGGMFTTAGGKEVNHIARWNGASWHPMGSGVSGGVSDMTYASPAIVFNGNLIVGGRFDTAGGQPAFGVAQWDGSTWKPMGNGMGSVDTLFIFNDEVAATSGGFIARWDGTSWQALGSGLGGGLNIASGGIVYDGDPIVAGNL